MSALENICDRLIKFKLKARGTTESGQLTAGQIISGDPDPDAHRKLITDELCLQRLADRRLESLIATLAPACVLGDTVLDQIEALIDRANKRVLGLTGPDTHKCPEVQIIVPDPPASSFQAQSNSLRALSKIVGKDGDGDCLKLCPAADPYANPGYSSEQSLKAEVKPAEADESGKGAESEPTKSKK